MNMNKQKPNDNNDKELRFFINLIKNKYSKYLTTKHAEQVLYKEICDSSNLYALDLCRLVLLRVNKNQLKKFMDTQEIYKVHTYKEAKLVIKTPKGFNTESLLDAAFGMYDTSIKMIETFRQCLTNCKKLAESCANTGRNISKFIENIPMSQEQISFWIIDCLALLTELIDPYSYGLKKLLCMLARIYTLIGRLGAYSKNVEERPMEAETFVFSSIIDVVSAFVLIGAPSIVLTRLKDLSAVTGVRIADSTIFVTIFCKLISFLYSVIEWINSKNIIDLKFILDLLSGFKDYADNFELVKEITTQYTAYIKNPHVIIDIAYRQKVLDIAVRCKSAAFLEYVNNDTNKFFKPLFKAFSDNVVKYASTFDVSSKEEPICFVFSGPPGCGKSVLMNALVSYLKRNRSVYVHTTPALTAGKDFYDDYLNQEVFVMDDVGQQSNSQWRHIINFVSPVKYPLECATAELKNTKFFNSKIILCTTNQFRDLVFTTTDGISDRGALFRRVHLFECHEGGDIQYWKYLYKDLNPRWVQEFVPPYQEFLMDNNERLPTTIEYGDNSRDKVIYLMKVLQGLERCQKHVADNVALGEEDMAYIDQAVSGREFFMDAQSASYNKENDRVDLIFDEISHDNVWRSLSNGIHIVNEFLVYLFNSISKLCSDLMESLMSNLISYSQMGIFEILRSIPKELIIAILVIMATWLRSYFRKDVLVDPIESNIMQWMNLKEKQMDWHTQGLSTIETSVKQHFRFVEINTVIDGKEVVDFCQALISGKRLLLPSHFVGERSYVKVYKDWQAYINKEIELDHQEIKILQCFPMYDTVVCEFVGMHVNVYKLAKSAFSEGNISTDDLRFVNCYHNLVLNHMGGYNSNAEKFTVRSLKGTFLYKEGDGIFYDISSKGLCGSGLISKSQGIVGIHVAGNGDKGFAVMWTKQMREVIKNYMIDTQRESQYEVKSMNTEFSGGRLIYPTGEITPARVISETSFVPSALHRTCNEKVDKLCEKYNIGGKAPPNFTTQGTAKKTLEKLGMKSFTPLGKVKREEIDFAEYMLDKIIPEFGDITLQEAVFGNERLEPMNKKSSNGYGWDLSKEDIFDYDTKEISKEFLERYQEFCRQCKHGDLKVENVLARETFKDELRTLEKVNSPRTFRVMPVQQIVATKVCFGDLLVKIREQMWFNEIAIGLNPYKDWGRLYEKMKLMYYLFDIDFSKWDGKLHAAIQDVVTKVLKKKYRGVHTEMLDVLLDTMTRGFVLIGDKMFFTTHSLSSGIWITALLNSIINKVISAMTLYRGYTIYHDPNYEKMEKIYYQLLDWAMGDDKLCGTPEKYKNYFNAIIMKGVAEDLGMDCTDGKKRKITSNECNIEDLVFLKRNFRYNKKLNRIVAPLSLDTIMNSIQWYDKTKDLDIVMNGKCIAAQIECYLHSEALSEEIVKIIQDSFPLAGKLQEKQILDIFESEDGYSRVMGMLGKFVPE